MSQSLSAILFPVAALAVHMLPAFQYHRFGLPGRLARETGLSSLFVFGLLFAVPAIVRTVGRELDTGIAASTLAHGVSRSMYFVAHLAGTLLVFLMFLASVFAATALSSFSCAKADTISVAEGVVRVWGPAFAVGVCSSIAPLALAALLNRLANRRFCLWTCILTVLLQLPGLALVGDWASAAAAIPQFSSLAVACAVCVAMAGALSVCMKANGVAACVAAAVVSGFVFPIGFIAPDMGVFWLAEGETSAFAPLCAGVALLSLWLVAGCVLLEGKELG